MVESQSGVGSQSGPQSRKAFATGTSNWCVYLRLIGVVNAGLIAVWTVLQHLQCSFVGEPAVLAECVFIFAVSCLTLVAFWAGIIADSPWAAWLTGGCALAIVGWLACLDLSANHLASAVSILALNAAVLSFSIVAKRPSLKM